MKIVLKVARDLLILIGGLGVIGLYLFGIIKGLIYTFNHWWVATNKGWECSSYRNITKGSKYTLCNSYYSVSHWHWGLAFGIILAILLTTILGIFISIELKGE